MRGSVLPPDCPQPNVCTDSDQVLDEATRQFACRRCARWVKAAPPAPPGSGAELSRRLRKHLDDIAGIYTDAGWGVRWRDADEMACYRAAPTPPEVDVDVKVMV